jgi:hypothetical protein
VTRVNPRLEGWHFFALSITGDNYVRRARKWCKDNFTGGYRVEKQMFDSQMVPGYKVCRGTVVWIENEDDFLLFKLKWWDYQ